ncbi:MAG: hypothetical protein NWE93_04695 [Candidatus Bathyarchaeota archaeon]|nr:hypothetical protein [Candidatus Bathyarchaeota archaeon]
MQITDERITMASDVSQNPLDIAQEHGRKIAGEIGAETFMELELSFATTRLPRFSNNPTIRTNQHVLLYRDQGYLKSTSIDEFIKCIPESYKIENVSGCSTEVLFGSISNDGTHITPPLFVDTDIAKIDELTSFLGSSTQMRDKVNVLNTIMENGQVSRHLIKLSQEEFPAKKISALREQGILYDPCKGELSFCSRATFWAATRPIDNRTYTYLKASGHLYRYHVVQNEISDEQAKSILMEDTKLDLELRQKLKHTNIELSKVSVKTLNTPSKSTQQTIIESLSDLIKDEFKVEKKRFADIINVRTWGDILREMAAHAFIRNAVENNFSNLEKVEYTAEDEEFIMKRLGHFIEFKVNPWFVEDFTTSRKKKKRPREEVKELILELLKSGPKQHMDIDRYANDHTSVCTATISNTLSQMVNEKQIYQPKHGFYALYSAEAEDGGLIGE